MSALVNTISIGALLAFSLVDGGLILLRYRTEQRPWQSLVLLGIFTIITALASLLFRFGFACRLSTS